jgi:heptosyltransferase-2/heptosyltransferase-3
VPRVPSRARRFLTRAAEFADGAHATQRACAIAAELTGPGARPTPRDDPLDLPVQDAAADAARELLRSAGVIDDYVVVHPGAGADVKLWPPQRWRGVLEWLRQEGLQVVATGTERERALVGEVVDAVPGAISLAGQTPLDVLIETLRGATLTLGPDCGPLHLAVATGTPTVHIFGPSDPARYGPWGPAYNHRVVTANWTCPRCGDLSPRRSSGCGCMLAVGVDDVLGAAQQLLHGHAVAR